MTLFDMDGMTAVITGSTKGIGKAIAERMAEHGANVVISSRKADACDAVAAEINEKWAKGGNKAAAIPCHIGYKEQLQALVDQSNDTFGKIDVLVCNAAVNPYFGPSRDIPDSAFDRIMEVNVRSNFWLSHMVAGQMAERGDGSIIIVSSIGGLKGSATLGVYGISKAADMELARVLAVEYGPNNVRANAIAPGLVRTEFARELWDHPEKLKVRNAVTPLRRIGEPDEIAGIAVMLATKAGSFVTGQTLIVDGGVQVA
jgi:NAD(P)-dependent dehydrogenase (short-subunit alcohol dehydrogenase family)